MKLLVLGGSGLVGNALIKMYHDNFEIIATYNKNPISLTDIRSLRCSLPEDFNRLEEFIQLEKPEIVVNSLGFSNIDFCESNKSNSYSLHVDSTEKICSLCSKLNTKSIFLSSDYVFDGKKGNYSESDEPNPINYYGFTKLTAEKIVLKNPINTVLRTSVIYDWDDRVRFFHYVVENLKKGREVITTNDVFNSVTLADSLTQTIYKVITLEKNGIFHAVDSTCVNRFEFARTIAKIFHLNEDLIKSISIYDTNAVAKRPKNACLDNSKAKNVLGVNFNTVEEGVQQVFKKSKN